jgi:vacuolar-type H+-ATPase subunit I/STV1
MDWNVVEAFFNTETGKKLIKEALDKDQYWDKSKQGPSQDEIKIAHPGGGVTTQVSNPGKGGEGVYDVKKSDIKATGPSADAHVETLDEVHEVIDEVARRDPKGVQGKNVQKFTKKAEEKEEKEEKKEEKEEEKKEEKKEEEKKEASLLEKLVRIANALDEKGLTDEANQIDMIIREETQRTQA